MGNNVNSERLLVQSKEEYSKFLESHNSDVFAQAGELLWESLKAHIIQVRDVKTKDIKSLTKTASQMGESFNELFFHCYHFHSWYLGEGVPNDFTAEKKLYLEAVESLNQLIVDNGNGQLKV